MNRYLLLQHYSVCILIQHVKSPHCSIVGEGAWFSWYGVHCVVAHSTFLRISLSPVPIVICLTLLFLFIAYCRHMVALFSAGSEVFSQVSLFGSKLRESLQDGLKSCIIF